MVGRLIIFVAPSGGGKTTVINHLRDRHPEIVHSISYTTRPERPGGVDDGYYQIVDEADFRDGIRKGDFVEWAEVHGYLYGTPHEPIDNWLAEGRDVILDLDVVGALSLKKAYGDRALTIFITPPSLAALQERLDRRGSESIEVRRARLDNAVRELEFKDRFDRQVINDDLLRACHEVEKILFEGEGQRAG